MYNIIKQFFKNFTDHDGNKQSNRMGFLKTVLEMRKEHIRINHDCDLCKFFSVCTLFDFLEDCSEDDIRKAVNDIEAEYRQIEIERYKIHQMFQKMFWGY